MFLTSEWLKLEESLKMKSSKRPQASTLFDNPIKSYAIPHLEKFFLLVEFNMQASAVEIETSRGIAHKVWESSKALTVVQRDLDS